MKFVPRRPRKGVNVSKTHPLIEAGTLVVGLTILFFVVVVALVFIVEAALFFVSAEDEAELFANWLPEDLVTVAPDDERLSDSQQLIDRLVQHWPDSPYEFRIEIHESEQSNAMALPGGLIVVTTALLDQVESENELAFVLGHELGHFKNRDHLRALGRGVVIALVMAVASGGDSSGIGVRTADFTLRSFGRQQETLADEFGLLVVNSEYGHIDEAWRLFDRWSDQERADSEVWSYFSTHPDTGNRIEDMQALAEARGWQRRGPVAPLPWR